MTDEDLVEVAARAMLASPKTFDHLGSVDRDYWLRRARAVIAAVGPKIREAAKERAAKVADDWAWATQHYEEELRAAQAIAAAIRDDKEG